MAKTVRKSRVFAIILPLASELGVYVVYKRTEVSEDSGETSFIDVSSHKTKWPLGDRNELIALLKAVGLTVRFFDNEEKQWMDDSLSHGYVRVPGNRDGTWTPPRSVEDFEENYLKAL